MASKRPKSAKVVEVKANPQVLPPKQAALYKQILKFYETKQYKKALKAAEQILSKFPQNGETLAMKGLTLNCLKKKDEARALVKLGLSKNVKSHICWHVYGLLDRSERRYMEAIKSYQNALRIDPGNLQILKDLSLLQVQLRLGEGFMETRRRILVLKANNRNNWLAYAIGAHLCGKFSKAIQILESYQNTQEDKKAITYEDSEMRLYKNQIIEESGDAARALKDLDENEPYVLDKLHARERRGQLLLEAGKPQLAEAEYRYLMDLNPDNYAYHEGLRRSLGLADASAEGVQGKLLELYRSLQSQFPQAGAPTRIPLDFSTGEQFKSLLDAYMRNGIRKGIPSLFIDLLPLYNDAGKVKVFEDLLQSYLKELRTNLRFAADQAPKAEMPSALLWTLYYAGNHYDHLNDCKQALAAVDEAIAHTPTTIDLYMLKARILKHVGDHVSGFAFMDKARQLDTADRYLNTKCTRYALRADKVEDAHRIVSLFLRDGDTVVSLYDMQCMWYELSIGQSYVRTKQYGKALKKFIAIDKHFETIHEDQFDFHTYCLRKMTLRAYVSMLRWEDKLRSHRFFFKAARAIIDVYLRIFDEKPKVGSDEEVGGENFDSLSPAEKKRLQKAAKRKQNKAITQEKNETQEAKAEAEKKAKIESNRVKGAKDMVDDDPDGDMLARPEDPLAEATKFLEPLQLYSSNEIETHLLALEVYSRKAKPLLVLKALKKASALNPTHPVLHYHLLKFLITVQKQEKKLNPIVKQVIDLECKSSALGGGVAAKELNDAFLAKHRTSLPHRLAVARAWLELDANKCKEAVTLVSDLASVDASFTIQDAQEVDQFLTACKDTAAALKFKSVCRSKFPYTPYFMEPESLEKLRISAEAENAEEP